MYHVWLKAKNENGVSDFGPISSSNEGEWTLLWVSFSKKQVSFRRNYGQFGGHLVITYGHPIYNGNLWGPQGQIVVENLNQTLIVEDNFKVGNVARIFYGNNPDIYTNAVLIGE